MYCPDCGEMVMKGDSYCPHCGAYLNCVEDCASYDVSGFDIESCINDMLLNRVKRKLEEFMSAKDVTDLSTREGRGEFIFMITLQNKYVRTVLMRKKFTKF